MTASPLGPQRLAQDAQPLDRGQGVFHRHPRARQFPVGSPMLIVERPAAQLFARRANLGRPGLIALKAAVAQPAGPRPPGARAPAARSLDEQRNELWLNPPEWTETRTLEFPGSVSGLRSRYVDPKTVNTKTGLGTVRYPRLEPRDPLCGVKLKKRTLTNLYNERPAWLDLAHKKLDAAYGWPADLSDEQILETPLTLNLERAAEEAKQTSCKKRERTTCEKRADEMI